MICGFELRTDLLLKLLSIFFDLLVVLNSHIELVHELQGHLYTDIFGGSSETFELFPGDIDVLVVGLDDI